MCGSRPAWWSSAVAVNGRHRRYYDLTQAGRQLLAAETCRLGQLATLGRQRLHGRDLRVGKPAEDRRYLAAFKAALACRAIKARPGKSG